MAISLALQSRPHNRRRSSSSFASRQSSTMRGIWTTLSAQPTALSNGRFYGIFEWKLPADNSVRTAEIGGRRRQAQHDHQGRVGIQLARGSQLQEVLLLACSFHEEAGRLRKAVAERHREKVCREDSLRQVAKSAVRADTPTAARLSAVPTVGVSLDASAEV